jgi:glycosyltransferase involved in cell wall biosynthesis
VGEARPHLLHVFSTFVPAGPQVRTVGLMRALGAEFRHSVLAMDGRTEALELLGDDLDVRLVEAPPRAGTLRTVPRMRALIRSADPDLLLTYNFGAMDAALASRSLGRAHVHHEDGFRPDEVEGLKRRRNWLRRIALRRAFGVVVISENLRRIAVETWRLPAERVRYIPNGIEVERFPKSDGHPELRAALGIPERAVIVGAVGHLRPEKNLPRLLEAVAALLPATDVHLLVLGEGPERERLGALAGAPPLAGHVHFAGYQADPREHYRAMDVFALSSDTEQMPIALLEAMACQLPIAATDVGDVRSMLPEEQRSLVTPRAAGAPALSRSIAELAAEEGLRRRLGTLNRRAAEDRFTLERMTRSYRDLFLAALRG